MAKLEIDFAQAMEARRLSAHFTAADLCCAGETWQRVRIWNEPQKAETWAALEQLCDTILEPVAARFGLPQLTYGFASLALFLHIPKGTARALDQHAACELGRSGTPVCPRMGAAVDFAVPSVSSLEIANWIADNLPFDRMYFYGTDRPLHVSVGPDNKKSLVQMIEWSPGRLRPQTRKLDWLKEALHG
jgi:hypothetical protein